MAKPIISIKLSKTDYAGLVDLGNRVLLYITGNLNYSTPAPPLATVQTAITAVQNAIALWGPKGNRGSHAQLVNLRLQAQTLWQILKALSQYVQDTAQIASSSNYSTMADIIITSGFAIANRKPQGRLQKVQGYHHFVTRKVDTNQVKLKWKKPLNTKTAGNVKSYNVFRSATNNFSTAVQIATTTKTSFIDTPSLSSDNTRWSYWIVPTNTNGDGVASHAITLTVPGM